MSYDARDVLQLNPRDFDPDRYQRLRHGTFQNPQVYRDAGGTPWLFKPGWGQAPLVEKASSDLLRLSGLNVPPGRVAYIPREYVDHITLDSPGEVRVEQEPGYASRFVDGLTQWDRWFANRYGRFPSPNWSGYTGHNPEMLRAQIQGPYPPDVTKVYTAAMPSLWVSNMDLAPYNLGVDPSGRLVVYDTTASFGRGASGANSPLGHANAFRTMPTEQSALDYTDDALRYTVNFGRLPATAEMAESAQHVLNVPQSEVRSVMNAHGLSPQDTEMMLRRQDAIADLHTKWTRPVLGLAGGLGIGLLANAMMPQQAYAAGQPIRDQLAPAQRFVDELPPTQLEHALLDRPMQAIAYRLQPVQQAFQKSWDTLGAAAAPAAQAVQDWLYPRPPQGGRILLGPRG